MLSTLLTRRTTAAACLIRRHSTAPGPNEDLIQALSRYMEEEKASASSNSFKVQAYSKAINTIARLPEQVRSVDQVRKLEGIGPRIADRIHAYLSGIPYEPPSKSRQTKTLEELSKKQTLSRLLNFCGIGPMKANELYDAGCRSLQDLREQRFLHLLTRPQWVSVQYNICRDRHMTREQASTIHDFVMQNISSKYTVLLSGDFRRGVQSAPHITLLVLHPHDTGTHPPWFYPRVGVTLNPNGRRGMVPPPFANRYDTRVTLRWLSDHTFGSEIYTPLECRGLLATTIAAGTQKWYGILRVPERGAEGNGWGTREERVRGVETRQGQFFSAEIYYVPRQCAGAASIALTGDIKFNFAVRKAASQLGLRLNEYGLWRWKKVTADAPIDEQQNFMNRDECWELVTNETEEDILEAVGMGWVAPERRNYANLDARSRKRKTEEEPSSLGS